MGPLLDWDSHQTDEERAEWDAWYEDNETYYSDDDDDNDD